jgi:hypothetical protein
MRTGMAMGSGWACTSLTDARKVEAVALIVEDDEADALQGMMGRAGGDGAYEGCDGGCRRRRKDLSCDARVDQARAHEAGGEGLMAGAAAGEQSRCSGCCSSGRRRQQVRPKQRGGLRRRGGDDARRVETGGGERGGDSLRRGIVKSGHGRRRHWCGQEVASVRSEMLSTVVHALLGPFSPLIGGARESERIVSSRGRANQSGVPCVI